MSLRREQSAELDRVYNDFMDYFQKKGMHNMHKPLHPPYMMPYPCYDIDHDNDCDNDEYYHKKHHNTKPMPKPHYPHNKLPYKLPYTTLPYELPYHTIPPYELPYTILPYPYSHLGHKRIVEETEDYTVRQSERANKVLEPTKNCNPNETFPTVYTPDIMQMEPRADNSKSVEQKYYKAMFTDLNKTLQPYVTQVIKNNNYVGSPINDKYFDRESLAQIVSEVLQRAKNNPKLVSFISSLDPKVREIMKNLVEALVLGELFVIHRPNTKLNEGNMMNIMPYNSQNARYNNMYGDPKNSKPLGEDMDDYMCMPCMESKSINKTMPMNQMIQPMHMNHMSQMNHMNQMNQMMQPMDMMNMNGMMNMTEMQESMPKSVVKSKPTSQMSNEMQIFSN